MTQESSIIEELLEQEAQLTTPLFHWSHKIRTQLWPHYKAMANARGHWAKNAPAIKNWRSLANGAAFRHPPIPATAYPVRALLVIQFPDNRGRDSNNFSPTIKAIVDGFVQAGLLAEDNPRYVVGQDCRALNNSGVKDYILFDTYLLAQR